MLKLEEFRSIAEKAMVQWENDVQKTKLERGPGMEYAMAQADWAADYYGLANIVIDLLNIIEIKE